MIRKLIFIIFIIFLSIFISNTFIFDADVVMNIADYQIITTTNFLLFASIIFLFSLYLIFYIFNIMFYPNVEKYKKQQEKLEKKFTEYDKLMTKGFIYKTIKDSAKGLESLKKANKLIRDTNLVKFLESQIYYKKKDYKKSEAIFKTIKDLDVNMDFLNLKLNLKEAKKLMNQAEIEKLAIQILKVEPTNSDCLFSLLEIYKNKKDWDNANKIIELGLKSKIFSGEKQKNIFLFIYTAVGKKYYDNHNFQKAKEFFRKAHDLDQNYIQSSILLVETYISLNKPQKALKIIKSSWKNNTNSRLADLYFSLQSEKDKNSIKTATVLYNLNSKSSESNLILAKAYFNAEEYSKARKYAKFAENINPTKDIYELMLKIEQQDNGSSTMISNLKNKILTAKNPCWKCNICKREYHNWQPDCNNCKGLDSLVWSE